jgi:hypothetical protein
MGRIDKIKDKATAKFKKCLWVMLTIAMLINMP